MTTADPIIDLVQEELDAYRRDGRTVHLAHAARALSEALSRARQDVRYKASYAEAGDVRQLLPVRQQ